jgi:hypothetical protein
MHKHGKVYSRYKRNVLIMFYLVSNRIMKASKHAIEVVLRPSQVSSRFAAELVVLKSNHRWPNANKIILISRIKIRAKEITKKCTSD